jgi:hypothetical protein
VLDGGDERELDALAPLVAGLGRRVALLDPEALVGVRLDPDPLDEGPVLRRLGRRAVVRREHPLRPPRDEVERRVRRDPVQPRAQRAAALEAAEPAPRAQERLLQGILRVMDRSEHPVAVGVQLGPVRLDQPPELVLRVGRGGHRSPLKTAARRETHRRLQGFRA